MSYFFTKKLKLVLVLAIIVCLSSLFTLSAQTICDNSTGSQGGYTYEYWKDNGSGCMVLGNGGAFSIDWSNINNLLARKGLRPGSWDNIVQYGANYQPNGNSYLCVYGWTTDPLVEYYIVESWGSWRPPGGQGFMGTVSSDGGTYDIYRTERVNQPSIIGTATFYQFWSVRQSKKTSGTITVGNHFRAWQGAGLNMGNMYEVSFCVEGYQSSGTANVHTMTISNNPGNTPTPTSSVPTPTPVPTLSSGNIALRASGTLGGERMELVIDGNVNRVWDLTTNVQTYYAQGTGSRMEVHFTNDDQIENGMDIQLDYLQYNGTTYQAEDQATNTAIYVDGGCGGSYSEWLHCDGYIRFDLGTTQTPTPTPTSPIITPTPGTGAINFGQTAYSVAPGSQFTTQLVAATSARVASYGITVNYDPSVVTYVSVADNGFGMAPIVNTTGNSVLLTAFTTDTPPTNGIATLTWRASNTLGASGMLSVAIDTLTDADYNNLGTTGGTASVVVASGGVKGDLNNDGDVTIVDALIAAQESVGLNPPIQGDADVNCDGSVTIVDALIIAQISVGLLNSFPC